MHDQPTIFNSTILRLNTNKIKNIKYKLNKYINKAKQES